MRRNHVVVFFTAFVIFVMFASTSTPCSGQQKWSGAYSVDLKNRYFGSTVCATFADEKVAQQELDITRNFHDGRTALTLNVWNSNGFKNAPDSFAYETDLDVNLTHKFGKYTASVGEWVFYLNPSAGTNVNVIDAKMSRTFTKGKNALIPFAELQRYDVTNLTAVGRGGTYPIIGANWNRPLTGRFAVATQAHINYDANGGFNYKAGKSMYYAEAALTFAIDKSTTVTLPRFGFGGAFNDPASGSYAGRPAKTIWGIGFSTTF
jgi:hypothetical protein